jgi:hypothetical protein
MKKILALLLIAGMTAFIACGPNKKDQEAKEKQRKEDSATIVSLMNENDSLTGLLKEKTDSLALLKKKNKGKAKTTKNSPKAKVDIKTQPPKAQ